MKFIILLTILAFSAASATDFPEPYDYAQGYAGFDCQFPAYYLPNEESLAAALETEAVKSYKLVDMQGQNSLCQNNPFLEPYERPPE